MHGWSADPQHDGPSGFKVKTSSYYDGNETEASPSPSPKVLPTLTAVTMDPERAARVQKEVCKCTPPDDDDDNEEDDDDDDDDDDE
mmetsp:Transcript_30240/g.50243  ORF Transcript_30240/g.50243 Transcript_30240/m.50243 type:complete len:86 (-) Transcript_30240:252-509(-)